MGNNCTKEFADGPLAFLTGTRGHATKSFGCNCVDARTCIHRGQPNAVAQPQLKCKCAVCLSLQAGEPGAVVSCATESTCEQKTLQHTVACPYHNKHVRRVHTYSKKRGIVITPCNCVCQCVVTPAQKSNPTSVHDLNLLENRKEHDFESTETTSLKSTKSGNSYNNDYEDDQFPEDELDSGSRKDKVRRNRRAAEVMFATLSPYYGTATYVHVQLFLHHPTPHCAFYHSSQTIQHEQLSYSNITEVIHAVYSTETYNALRRAIDQLCMTNGQQLADLMQLPCTCTPSVMLAQLQAQQRFQASIESNFHTNSNSNPTQSTATLSRQHSRSNSVAHARPTQDIALTHDGDVHSFFELEQTPLGQPGSFGKVVKCRERATGKEYACKIISKRKFANKWDGLLQFNREIQIMQLLKHPHVIEFQSVFADTTFFYIIMELCTGGEVMQCQSGAVQSEDAASVLLRQMLQAVGYLHEQGVVHCDLKPDNFLLNKSGPGGVVKLIDFGLSKFVGYRDKFTTIAGTAYFIAPEVLRGDYSQPCDLWSQGVVLFIMLFGFPPFDKRGDGNVMQAILQGFNPVVKPGRGAFFPADIPVSPAAMDLVARLLTMDTAVRQTTDEALNHPWFRTKRHTTMDPLVLRAMQNFNVKWRFQHALLYLFVDVLNEVSVKQLQTTFELLDVDKDGNVDIADLKFALREFYTEQVAEKHVHDDSDHSSQVTRDILENPAFTELEIDEILKKLDVDNDGLLKYEDLLLCLVNMTLCEKEERLVQAFSKLDVLGDGKVSVRYIMDSLLKTDEYRGQEESLLQMLTELDIAPDSIVGFEDFLAIMWSKHQYQVEMERAKVKFKKDRKKLLRAGKRGVSASPFKQPDMEPQSSNNL